MIGHLQGTLLEKHSLELILDVQGVGYEIHTSANTFYQLPEIGKSVALYIQCIIREDSQTLYGFKDPEERALFRELIKVSGIGPKTALAILSNMSVDQFVSTILQQHSNTLLKIPGIGQKTAERLIIELRDRFQKWQLSKPVASSLEMGSKAHLQPSAERDAIDALASLGYKPAEALKAIEAFRNQNLQSEELIRLALKNLGKYS